MAWLAVDKDKTCWVFNSKPYRTSYPNIGEFWDTDDKVCHPIDSETIEIILGRELAWKDEAVEIKCI